MKLQNIKFVAHDYCQQILGQRMQRSDEGDLTLPWDSTNIANRILFVLGFGILFTPLFILVRLGRDILICCTVSESQPDINDSVMLPQEPAARTTSKYRIFNHLDFPSNRFWAQTLSSIIYLFIIINFVFYVDNLASRIALLVFSLSHFFRDIGPFYRRVFLKQSKSTITFWGVYSILTDFLLLTGSCLAVYLHLQFPCQIFILNNNPADKLMENNVRISEFCNHDNATTSLVAFLHSPEKRSETCLTGLGVNLAFLKGSVIRMKSQKGSLLCYTSASF